MSRSMALACVFALMSVAVRQASACETCKSPYRPGTYTGEARRMGNGVAYTWVTLNEKGKPSSVGVTFTETALEGLPAVPPKGMIGTEYMLSLPRQADKTPFSHAVVNWNPNGHVPAGIYDVPHFDVHFYAIAPAKRYQITAVGKDLARCRKPVPAGYMAAGYIYAPGAEEREMGAHWVDAAAPELHGQRFTKTFVYGSYDGKVIFYEPMLTKAWIETRPEFSEPIKLPTTYSRSDFYPTSYSVRYDEARREYTVALEGMTWREAPAAKAKVAGRSASVKKAASRPASRQPSAGRAAAAR
ncbi:MAG: DUF5602 domain-containing protein [Chthonomonadales bacterium]|nr:DUF5602 domain-containing protein [Chthonomonadales bacterium]